MQAIRNRLKEIQKDFIDISNEIDKRNEEIPSKRRGGIITQSKRQIREEVGEDIGLIGPLVGKFGMALLVRFEPNEIIDVEVALQTVDPETNNFVTLTFEDKPIAYNFTVPNKVFLVINRAGQLIEYIRGLTLTMDNPILRFIETQIGKVDKIEETILPTETNPVVQKFIDDFEEMQDVPIQTVEKLRNQIIKRVEPEGLVRYYTEDGTLIASGKTDAEATNDLAQKLELIKQRFVNQQIVKVSLDPTESINLPLSLLGVLYTVMSDGKLRREGSEEVLYGLKQLQEEGYKSDSIKKFAEALLKSKTISKKRINLLLPKSIEQYKSIYEYYKKKYH